ncbi:MAG TPA: hypothetical protein VMZ71_05230 [Gemmataceae bacterium]|nr:hypothetical protein [Gemmataceae bacterium]
MSVAAQPAGVTPPLAATIPVIAGSGSGGITGSYRAYVRFIRGEDGQPSNLSTVSAETTVSAVGQIDYSNLPTSTQPGVTRRQLLRNTDGQYDVFYVDVDTTDLTSTTLIGTKTDAQLAASETVTLLAADGTSLANRYTVPPNTKPIVCPHQGRMWYAGEVSYAEGSAKVTRFSATVTGVATEWPSTFAGRVFYVLGEDRTYEIDSCDPVAQTLTLTEAYEGDTDSFAQYAVKPQPAEGALAYFSEAGLPEAVPAINAFSIPEDGGDVTGMRNFGSFLWFFKKRRVYRLTAQVDPAADGFLFYAIGRGCVNDRCHAVVEEMLYALDEGGVYRTGGGDQTEQLSDRIQNLLRKNEEGAVNWAASRYFHCVHSPAEEQIRWFVAFRGEYLPRHALCLHYKTGKWWVEEYAVPIGCSTLGRVGRPTAVWNDAGEQLYLGGPAGELYASGGACDGIPETGATNRGKVTAAGGDTLTDATAAFDATWENVPVCIVGGRGKGQLRVVVSATGTVLRVNEAWAIKPDTTSVYQVGGIRYRYTGGRLRYAPGEDRGARNVEFQFEPVQNKLTADFRLSHDFSVTPRVLGRNVGPGQKAGAKATRGEYAWVLDLSKPNGHEFVRFDGHREADTDGPRLMRVQVEGVSGPEVVRFGEMVLLGVVR